MITVQNFVAVSHTVCAHEGGLKKLGNAGPHDPLGGAVDALETRTLLPVPVCYHTRFRRNILNSLGVDRKPQKLCGNLGPRPPSDWGMADPRNRLLRHV